MMIVVGEFAEPDHRLAISVRRKHLALEVDMRDTKPRLTTHHDIICSHQTNPETHNAPIPPNLYQSPQVPSSSFFEVPDEDFIALVPTFLGLAVCCVCCVFASPAAAKSSQKSFFSLGGPAGSAPNESQKSFFSGAAVLLLVPEVLAPLPLACWCSGSMKLLIWLLRPREVC
jgi:hypothetical protein